MLVCRVVAILAALSSPYAESNSDVMDLGLMAVAYQSYDAANKAQLVNQGVCEGTCTLIPNLCTPALWTPPPALWSLDFGPLTHSPDPRWCDSLVKDLQFPSRDENVANREKLGELGACAGEGMLG